VGGNGTLTEGDRNCGGQGVLVWMGWVHPLAREDCNPLPHLAEVL